MSKSITRTARREQAKRIANKVLKTYGGEGELPTVEQLYTIIGAKDGFIYDLQLQLSGMVQERDAKDAKIAELEEALSVAKEGIDIEFIPEQGGALPTTEEQPIRVADVVELNAKRLAHGEKRTPLTKEQRQAAARMQAGAPNQEQDQETNFGATFKPQ